MKSLFKTYENLDSLFNKHSEEMGVYASSQGMFESNNCAENEDKIEIGNYELNEKD
jgi:hypothetical protein